MNAKELVRLHAQLEEGAASRGGKTGGLGFDAKVSKKDKAGKSTSNGKGSQSREFATTTAGLAALASLTLVLLPD